MNEYIGHCSTNHKTSLKMTGVLYNVGRAPPLHFYAFICPLFFTKKSIWCAFSTKGYICHFPTPCKKPCIIWSVLIFRQFSVDALYVKCSFIWPFIVKIMIDWLGFHKRRPLSHRRLLDLLWAFFLTSRFEIVKTGD